MFLDVGIVRRIFTAPRFRHRSSREFSLSVRHRADGAGGEVVRWRHVPLPPLVIMTPRSGWYRCASERGGGLACWLELTSILSQSTPARDVVFVSEASPPANARC